MSSVNGYWQRSAPSLKKFHSSILSGSPSRQRVSGTGRLSRHSPSTLPCPDLTSGYVSLDGQSGQESAKDAMRVAAAPQPRRSACKYLYALYTLALLWQRSLSQKLETTQIKGKVYSGLDDGGVALVRASSPEMPKRVFKDVGNLTYF